MSIYKKGINTIEKVKNVEYIMTNNNGIYMNQTVIGENTTPYHGLLIKQNELQDEIYLSKMIEQIKISGKTYSIKDISTNEEEFGGKEYLEEFSRYPVPTYNYVIEKDVKIKKEYLFSDDNALCISYNVVNDTNSSINIKLLPVVNKRGIFSSKRESMLKLNTDSIKDGAKVTLSITQQKYLYLKSLESKFNLKPHYINGIKYNYEINREETKTYIEDAYVPRIF